MGSPHTVYPTDGFGICCRPARTTLPCAYHILESTSVLWKTINRILPEGKRRSEGKPMISRKMKKKTGQKVTVRNYIGSPTCDRNKIGNFGAGLVSKKCRFRKRKTGPTGKNENFELFGGQNLPPANWPHWVWLIYFTLLVSISISYFTPLGRPPAWVGWRPPTGFVGRNPFPVGAKRPPKSQQFFAIDEIFDIQREKSIESIKKHK